MPTKRKASFYGVRIGKQPGVYDNWEACKVQVIGFPRSEYKGFQTRAEAENYVNVIVTAVQDLSDSKPVMDQIQANTISNEKYGCQLFNTAPSIGIMSHEPSDKVRPLKKKVNGFKKQVMVSKELTSLPETFVKDSSQFNKIAVSKEQIIPLPKTLVEDSSQYYKLIEENGHRFVVFDSLKEFDSYFKALCHSGYHSKTQILETVAKNHEFKTASPAAAPSQPLQAKIAAEDDAFVYFRDENDLIEFLRPYFKDAKQSSFLQTTSQLQNGVYLLEFDGACKGNPGNAGAGALIRCPHGSVVLESTQFLGTATNNIAEYRALLLGLKSALSNGIQRVQAKGDSKLVCLQVVGAWKVENENLIPLYEEVMSLTVLFESFSITHVRREYNRAADALANEAIRNREMYYEEVARLQPECCLNR